MILQEFSKELIKYGRYAKPSVVLTAWLKNILEKQPETPVEKIIHYELTIIDNNEGIFSILAKRKSGQRLLDNLYNYIQSFEHQEFCRWLHVKKANDFNATREL